MSHLNARFEVRATCTAEGTAKFGHTDMMWCGRTRPQAEKALARMKADCGYCWVDWHIVDHKQAARVA